MEQIKNTFDPDTEWVDMPEFVMEDLAPERKIIVSFRSEEDVLLFAQLIKQKITPRQKSLWFPEMPERSCTDKRYIDEETNSFAPDIASKLEKGFLKT